MSISEPMVSDPDVDIPELRFKGGLPGFPNLERFTLVQWGDEPSPFSLLQSLEQDLSFVVVPPSLFFPDYEPEITDDTAANIGVETAEQAMVLVIVTIRQPVHESTANLLGPLIINTGSLDGTQAVLDPEKYEPAVRLAAG